jgi:hypothetical protein
MVAEVCLGKVGAVAGVGSLADIFGLDPKQLMGSLDCGASDRPRWRPSGK